MILGIGNPLLDLSCTVPMEFINKYEALLGQNILCSPKQLPMFAEMEEKYEVTEVPGGAAQNAIRGAQFLLGETGATGFIGCVGNDHFGRRQREICESYGVKVSYQINPEVQTGTCAALVHGAERALVANIGAAGTFKATHMALPEVQEMIQRAKIMYTEGFFLMVSMPAIKQMAEHCLAESRRGQRKMFCLNLSALFVIDCQWAQLQELLPYVDVLFGNEDEARSFAKKAGWQETDVGAIAALVAALPKLDATHPRTVVFTQGTGPTRAAVAGVHASGAEALTFPIESVPAAELKDTNGAGDSFVAGFLASMVKDKPLAECIAAGHRLAAIKVRHTGCVWA